VQVYDGYTGRRLNHILRFDCQVYNINFSPDGKYATIKITPKDRLAIVNTQFWKVITILDFKVRCAEFSPDSDRLATANLDNTINIWQVNELVNEQRPEPIEILRGHSSGIGTIVFSKDGNRILTGSGDRTARLWDVQSGETIHVLKGHASGVGKAVFTCDEERIVTGSGDATIRIWDSKTGKLLLTSVEYESGNWLAFESAYGYYTGTSAAADWARIRVKDRDYPLSSYDTIFYNPDKVQSSLEGKQIKGPAFVFSAPELEITTPKESGKVQERSFLLEAWAKDTYGFDLEKVQVNQDGVDLPVDQIKRAIEETQNGKKVTLSLMLGIPEGQPSTTIKVRVTNTRDIKSEIRTIALFYE